MLCGRFASLRLLYVLQPRLVQEVGCRWSFPLASGWEHDARDEQRGPFLLPSENVSKVQECQGEMFFKRNLH